MTDGPRSFGKYLLEREIARGGMARVHLAKLRGLGGFEKRLVVKEILPELASDPKFVAMFVEEAKVLVALSHPNIVPVYELGIVDGTYFLAMEHVEGATLADIVRTRELTQAEAARMGAEIADALAYAHERFDIVHRDVSPRNVMVDTAGHARLLDFGIAARADVYRSGPQSGPDTIVSARRGGHSGSSEGDALYGTPGFLSPEQARGEKLGPASDLFSLGCVLTFAVRGASPFGAKELDLVRNLRAAPETGIDGPLGRIVNELLAATPNARPASARAVARTLGAAASALEREEESAMSTLATRATERAAKRSEPPPPMSSATGPVTPGRVEVLAKSQALDVILGTAKITSDAVDAPGTAKIERARPASVPPTPNVVPAVALSIALALVAAAFAWNARFELTPTPVIDPVDHGLTTLADIAPIPIEDAGEEDASEPIADAGPSDAGTLVETDTGVTRARDAGTARAGATLAVRAYPWAAISVDGHAIGNTPIEHYRLTPGAHSVRAENPATGHSEVRAVEATAGETVSLRFSFE